MQALPASTVSPLQDLPALPVSHAAALKTWFKANTLKQGFDLIGNGEIYFFSFQRRHAGLITDEQVQATVQMAAGKGKLRFVFKQGACSQCVGRSSGTRCRHVAALAILCLREKDKLLTTLADTFPASPWAEVGGYLYNRMSMGGMQMEIDHQGGVARLLARNDSGLDLCLALSPDAAAETACLARLPGTDTRGPDCSALEELREKLELLSATANERELNLHGSRSRQQQMERSLFLHLARLCFLHLPQDALQTSEDSQGRYSLRACVGEKEIFHLRLPRQHTWELLDRLAPAEKNTKPATAELAEQFCRVYFADQGGDLVVEHWCRLADGTEYSLEELEEHRYGTRYRVDDRLFSLQPIPENLRLREEEKKQLSLFGDSTTMGTRKKTRFIIPSAKIARFTADHAEQLHSGHHRVAREILDMEIVQVPDTLVLDQYSEQDNWCYLAGWYGLGSHQIRLVELLQAVDASQSLLVGPVTLQLDKSVLAWFHRLGIDRIVDDDQGQRIRLRRSEFLALAGLIGKLELPSNPTPGSLPEFILDQARQPEITAAAMPAHLRAYQRHGAAWMYQLQQYRLGGILADDMGLGKTHQALALVSLSAREESRVLLVCPAAVLHHWPEKQERFFPDLSLAVYHGPGRDLGEALGSRIVLTTYGVLRRDGNLLAEINFQLVIFDEMHYLKNRSTAAYEAAAKLQADAVFGLTGTPVENKITELGSLFSLCLPALFGLKGVQRMFHRGDSRKNRQALQRFVSPFILRRTRAQVLDDLPECSEDIRLCSLSREQVAAYRQAADQALGNLDAEETLPDFSYVLTTIIRLKQICNHLAQLEKSRDWSRYPSGKWDEFTRLVHQSLETELKVVVFSQFTTMLDLIEAWLRSEKIGHVGLRGSVPAEKRGRLIHRFNTDPDCRVCCASLLAGGTGIDLTGAQVVIHYDRWWNPAKEEQATARVHRMGQRHPVQVYKLVTVGTLEEKIHRLIEKKRQLAAELVVEDDSSILKTLDRAELADLFRLSQ